MQCIRSRHTETPSNEKDPKVSLEAKGMSTLDTNAFACVSAAACAVASHDDNDATASKILLRGGSVPL